MLYFIEESLNLMLSPARQSSRVIKSLIKEMPHSGFSDQWVNTLNAWVTVFEEFSGIHEKPKWNIHETQIDGIRYLVEDQVVLKRAYCQLVHFKKLNCEKSLPRLFIIAPYSGHYSTLLRQTVETFLPHHDVYITDWLNCKQIPLASDLFNLNDFIDYLVDFMHFLGTGTHVLAVCQPTVAALAATAIMADWGDRCQPKSLTLVAGPIDARQNPTVVNQFAIEHDLGWFEKNLIQIVPPPNLGAGRKVYPGFIQLNSFMAMNPERHLQSIESMFESLVEGNDEDAEKKKDFYDEYLSVMDLTAEFYLQTIDQVFLKFSLAKGEMMSRWHRVDTAHIKKTHLLVIEGEKDDICGIGQTQAALQITNNLPDHFKDYLLVPNIGHYGTFNGRIFREQIAPKITQFIHSIEN
ncbi:MAG: polyhydroxyalkanoate depolymerase [Betaproteobacteria bacterium]|uniref:polyhydroxyalkanoate depolymerase n=1 Tax=Ferrovum sp. PN-J185 TaxID=1356306 RepID=UPI00079AD434|nr:polyhydroxyalkanoate depolymerase [Ferrovum sp. PN-J185]KXW56536.1 hypothetical protein FV185_04880 [Ferrovum sp. PN-J185]MDE1891773.1 polyhydroxyalkanoate depolymerase [Betaproteobacteria bacterium]MDE2056381.1 polyhydroxyalkanoate depolymerase [Betaproteobacteria bacterium]